MGVGKKEFSSTRNLEKGQLGGVIFGATNVTIKECLSKQLFGLPKEHLVYVEKIEPGLPLFLFNYSDRKLHGVFEAASHGQYNIDSYAWTSDGRQCSPYPAQVQVLMRSADSPRHPLTENQFKPIIVDNYFSYNKFWFELDHAQTSKLLSLFSSQSLSASHLTPKFQYVPKSDKKMENEPKAEDVRMSFNGMNLNPKTENWIGTKRKDEKQDVFMKLNELDLNRIKADPPSVFIKSSEDATISQLIEKVEDLMSSKTEQNRKIGYLEEKIIFLEQNLAEAQNEIRNLKNHCVIFETMMGPSDQSDTIIGNEFQLDNDSAETSDTHLDCDDLIYLVGGYDGRSWFSSLDCWSSSQNQTKLLKPMNTGRCYAPVSMLDGQLYVFGGGTRGVWYDAVESYDPVLNEWTARPSLNSKKGSLAGATLNGKIYAVGGGSDNEFYSAVEMLDLHIGAWIPSPSMHEQRFSLAAAELNGSLYAVGGYDGKNYLKSAERFDPRERSWTRIESMNTMRGCPCLVVLNEKLYVLGGFDSNEMVPSVEIYDPRRGSWVLGESMKYARGFSAAAVVKESLYIFGGLKNGQEINDTVECYNEGRGWETLEKMAGGRRCFFSAIAL
ncbi:uncharacterized protein [Rutidosis leptorrhynchoides]|uniref:uncharacterized protein n=1 Tax=Rutidosis leptorrhynchoides TaxID=125765 RepID=UPI003A99C31D